MRQQVIALILALGLLGTLTHYSVAGNNMSKNENRLPKNSQEFLKKHFPNEKISYVIVDKDGLQTTFEVMLTSGKEIEFYKNGEWKEIDAKKTAVPQTIIPANILKHVKDNFDNDVYVVQIEKKFWGIEVELSNKLEVEYTSGGKFLRYDN